MTLHELKALSDSIADDREFLDAVRDIWWGIVEPGRVWLCTKDHMFDECPRCHRRMTGLGPRTCPVPDPIPVSLADSAEKLREIVAGKWPFDGDEIPGAFYTATAILGAHGYIHDSARTRWIIFACAAGGVEIEGETQ